MNRRTFFKITAGLSALAAGIKSFALTPEKPLTSLDRVGIRRMIVLIKQRLAQLAENYVFDPNTQEVREQFSKEVNEYMESVKNRRGIYEYKLICDETTNPPSSVDNNIIYGQLWIQPRPTVEYVIIDFNIFPMIKS